MDVVRRVFRHVELFSLRYWEVKESVAFRLTNPWAEVVGTFCDGFSEWKEWGGVYNTTSRTDS